MIAFSVLDLLVKKPPFELAQASEQRQGRRDWLERQLEPAVQALRKSVQDNLEWVLNTRRIPPPPKVLFAGYKRQSAAQPANRRDALDSTSARPHLESSVFFYGLPNFANISLSAGPMESDVNLLAAEIKGTIVLFEPRILDPDVVVEQMPTLYREICFRVTGRLKIEPDPLFVQYRTALDIDRVLYKVNYLGGA